MRVNTKYSKSTRSTISGEVYVVYVPCIYFFLNLQSTNKHISYTFGVCIHKNHETKRKTKAISSAVEALEFGQASRYLMLKSVKPF